MSKLIVVTGATGLQGSGVIDALSANTEWKIRGITRNTNSEKARRLIEQGIEMVAADLDDEPSLTAAFVGAHAIFAVTDFYEPFSTGIGPEKAQEIEYNRGVRLARAAMKTATLETYFWSTLPAASKLTNGEVEVPHFDAKAAIDEYIKNHPVLNAKAIFLLTGFYPSNFGYPPFTPIYSKPAARWTLLLPASPTSYLPSMGSVSNIGVIVRALLEKQYPQPASGPRGGRYIHVTTGKYQMQEYFSRWAEIAGIGKLQVLSVPFEQFEELHGMWGTELGLMVKFWEVAGAPKMWGTVGEGDVMSDCRDLEGVNDCLSTAEDFWRREKWEDFQR